MTLRVMVVRPGPRYSVFDVHRGLVDGLRRNGVSVWDFRYDEVMELYSSARLKRGARYKPAFDEQGAMHLAGEHLQAAAYRFWPHVIVLVSAFWIPAEVLGILRMRPHHVAAWLTESPYEDDRQLRVAQHCDTVIVNDPTNLDAFRAVTPNSHYLPHSYDPDLHAPGAGKDEWRCDVAFAGTGFPSRVDFMEQVDWSGIDLRLGGMWAHANAMGSRLVDHLMHPVDECIDNADAVTLYRSAKASFNLYRREATQPGLEAGWAMGPREVELAATGTFFVRDPRPEGDELFPMLPTFTEPAEFGDKLRWWLAHDDERQTAAEAARAAVADRTFAETARKFLRLLPDAATAAA